MADLAVHPLDVHRGIPEPRAGFHSMGIRVFDLQPGRPVDHGYGGDGLYVQAGCVGKHGRRAVALAPFQVVVADFQEHSYFVAPHFVAPHFVAPASCRHLFLSPAQTAARMAALQNGAVPFSIRGHAGSRSMDLPIAERKRASSKRPHAFKTRKHGPHAMPALSGGSIQLRLMAPNVLLGRRLTRVPASTILATFARTSRRTIPS